MRLSVGIEDVEDLIADIEQALRDRLTHYSTSFALHRCGFRCASKVLSCELKSGFRLLPE